MNARCFVFLLAALLPFSGISALGRVQFANDSVHYFYLSPDPDKLQVADTGLAGQGVPQEPLPSGVTLVAGLYAGTSSNSLSLQPYPPYVFGSRPFDGPGHFLGGNITLTFAGGAPAYFEARVWESTFSNYEAAVADGGCYLGKSGIFTFVPGTGLTYPQIYRHDPPTLSTWTDGTYDLSALYGPGVMGAVEVAYAPAIPNPPSFPTQPQSQSVEVGSNVTLSATVHSSLAYDLRWQKDNLPVNDATNASLNFSSVTLGDAGHYVLFCTNALGTTNTTTAALQVLPPNAPSIQVNGELGVGTVTVAASATIAIAGGFGGGFIFYTLDGSVPTTGSTLYTGAFVIATNRTIRAMSLSGDFLQSSEAPAVNVVLPPLYSLTITSSGGGSVAVSPPVGPYLSNSVVTLTATAATNWIFDHWSGDLSGSVNPTNLTMNGARSVQAVFIAVAYPLTIGTAGGGSVTADGLNISPNTYYPTASVVSLAAATNSGWSFVNWQGTATSSANPFNLSMTRTQNVQAIFGTTVGTFVGGSGGISLSASNPVPYGTILTVTAVPAPGNYFVTWSGAASGTNNPATVSVTNPAPTIGALFAASPASCKFQSITRLPNGCMQMVLKGQSNATIWIDRSLSVPPGWQELTNLYDATGTVTFTDCDATNHSQQFYRARQ